MSAVTDHYALNQCSQKQDSQNQYNPNQGDQDQARIRSATLLALFDSIDKVLLAIDDDQRIVTINHAWTELSGHGVAPSLNKAFTDFIHDQDLPNFRYLSSLLKPNTRERLWLRILKNDALPCWCELSLQRLRPNEPYPISIQITDISAKVKHDERQQAKDLNVQKLVNGLPVMLYRAKNTPEWLMEYLSQGCLYITGYQREKMLGQSVTTLGSLIHESDTKRVWESVQQALQNRTGFDLRYQLKQRNGTYLAVRDIGHGLYNEQGQIEGVEGLIISDCS